jgi:hypothetical protein
MDKARTSKLRRSLLALYKTSWAAELCTRIKLVLLPLGEIAEQLPKRGLIHLSLDNPERVIVANDPAESRIYATCLFLGGEPIHD